MSIRRKTALKRLIGLAPMIEAHLELLDQEPNSTAVLHWKAEIRSWLRQMNDVLPHVGGRTARVWQDRLEAWASLLEE